MRKFKRMNTLMRAALLVTSSSILATSPGLATAGEEQVPVGPRPLAMGGAFTAIADGPDAMYWNPAGLAGLSLSTIRVTQAELHGLGIEDNVVGLVAPAFGRFGVGLEWYRSGYRDDVFEDALDRLGAGIGWRVSDRVRVGATLRYRRYGQTFGGVDQGTGAGFGADVGALVRPWRSLQVGFMWRDAGGSELEFDDGSTSTPYEQAFDVGVAWRVRPEWVFAADLGRDLRMGTEIRVVEALTIRAGWSKDRDGLDDGRVTAGFGVRLGPTVLEYAFQDHPALDPTHHVGLSLDFSLAPRLVEVRDARLDPLFSSFYKDYARESAGELIVENLHDEPLEIVLRVENETLIHDDGGETIILRPGVAQRLPLRPLLADDVLDVREPTPSDFRVSIQYVSNGRTRTDRRDLRTIVYEPGTLTWGEGVARAAAFITPTHRVIEEYARRMLDTEPSRVDRFLNRTATTAALVFNGLSAQGFTYTPDPLNPFSNVQGNAVAVDDIQYPVELLQSKRGDCDDMSVLYASLLESVGIRTALVDVPGHIFVMVDTGLRERDRRLTGYPPELFVVRSGGLWIPVETTSLGEPFHVAWRAGADLYARWQETGRSSVVDVLDARAMHEAAVYGAPGDDAEVEVTFDGDAVAALNRKDLAEIGRWREDYLRATETDVDAVYEEALVLARVFYLNQDFERAADELDAIAATRRDATVWNNLGAARLATARIDAANAALERARTMDPTDPGIALNRGIGLRLAGDVVGSRGELAFAVERSGGIEGALGLLGVREVPTGATTRASETASLDQLSLEKIEQLLQDALTAVPEADSVLVRPEGLEPSSASPDSVGTETSPADGDDEATERVIAAGHRAGEIVPDEIGNLLYWRHRAIERNDP